MSKSKIPAIPEPIPDLHGLYLTVMALKAAIEVLGGHKLPIINAAVTWEDLVDLGIVARDQLPK